MITNICDTFLEINLSIVMCKKEHGQQHLNRLLNGYKKY